MQQYQGWMVRDFAVPAVGPTVAHVKMWQGDICDISSRLSEKLMKGDVWDGLITPFVGAETKTLSI